MLSIHTIHSHTIGETMIYLKNMGHKCLRHKDNYRLYHVVKCRACNENARLKKQREEFEKMMSTSLSWDIEDQGAML